MPRVVRRRRAKPRERLAPIGVSPTQAHAYAGDLAGAVLSGWRDLYGVRNRPSVLERLPHVISICYQASLLQEEGRPVTFRVAFAQPDAYRQSLVSHGT